MKKLSKKDEQQKAELLSEAERAKASVEDAIATFNEALSEAFEEVKQAVEDYNETLGKLEEFRDEVAEKIHEYTSDRSDKWQESERGQAYESWLESWQELDFERIEIDQPDELDVPDMEHPEEFSNAPSEPEV